MLRFSKNLSGLDTIVYLSAHNVHTVLKFVVGHLPFQPYSDGAIELQANPFCETLLLALYVSFKLSRKIPMLKRTGEEADYVASFVTEIVFKAKLDSRTRE